MYREVDHLIIGAGATGMQIAKLLLDPQSGEKSKQVLVVDDQFSKVSLRLLPSQIRTLPFQLMEKAQDTSRLFASSSQSFSPFHAISSYLLETLDKIKSCEQKKASRQATLRALGAAAIEGKATLVDAHTVRVDACKKELILKAKNIYLALGSKESAPSIQGLSAHHYLLPSDLLQLKQIPRSWIVVGGTPLGCVLAQSFSSLGISTTLIEPGPKLLDHSFPESIRDKMKEHLVASNVLVKTSCRLQEAELFPDAGHFLSPKKSSGKEPSLEPGQLLIESGAGQLSWHHGQAILFACHRRARLEAIGEMSNLSIDKRLGIHTDSLTGKCLMEDGQWSDSLYAFGSCSMPLEKKQSFFPTRLGALHSKSCESKDTIQLRRTALIRGLKTRFTLQNTALPLKAHALHTHLARTKKMFQTLLQAAPRLKTDNIAHTLFIPTTPPVLQITSDKFLSTRSQKKESVTLQVPAGEELQDQLVIAGGERESIENSGFLQSGYMAEIICSKNRAEILKITIICPQAQEIACSLQQAISTGMTLEEICKTHLVSYAPIRLFEQALLQFQCLKKRALPSEELSTTTL